MGSWYFKILGNENEEAANQVDDTHHDTGQAVQTNDASLSQFSMIDSPSGGFNIPEVMDPTQFRYLFRQFQDQQCHSLKVETEGFSFMPHEYHAHVDDPVPEMDEIVLPSAFKVIPDLGLNARRSAATGGIIPDGRRGRGYGRGYGRYGGFGRGRGRGGWRY